MKEGEKYVTNAHRNGLITQAQLSVLRKHARHHFRCEVLRCSDQLRESTLRTAMRVRGGPAGGGSLGGKGATRRVQIIPVRDNE